MSDTPVALFDVDEALIVALEARLGPPIDSYLNGWQVWIEAASEDDEAELEYRLHPPVGFEQPEGLGHHDLWDAVAAQVAAGETELALGTQRRSIGSLWSVLEVFPAYGDARSPQAVRAAAEARLGRTAAGAGYVDHERMGGAFRRHGHAADIPGRLRHAITG